jgi:hypothetical protein
MKETKYSLVHMDKKDLERLCEFACHYLETYPYTMKFKDQLLGIALCQGAANHYAVCNGAAKRYFDSEKCGIKDIDVWFFFKKTVNHNFNNRWLLQRDFGESKFGRNPDDEGYFGRRVDFLGRSIEFNNISVEGSIRDWITHGGGSSPYFISQKVVVGLYPADIFNKFIWINAENWGQVLKYNFFSNYSELDRTQSE